MVSESARPQNSEKYIRTTARPVKADAITMIREVKALAAKAGGYDKLKELVDALAE